MTRYSFVPPRPDYPAASVAYFCSAALTMGIYSEVPKYRSVLDPYREPAAIIEQSDLDYTILRPGWFTREPAGPMPDYAKGSPSTGLTFHSDSLSALIAKIATTPGLYVRCSLGISDG